MSCFVKQKTVFDKSVTFSIILRKSAAESSCLIVVANVEHAPFQFKNKIGQKVVILM